MSDGFSLAKLLSAFRDLIRLVPYQKGTSDPWNDVGDETGGDPVDNAGVDIGYLEQRRSLGVPGTTIDPNHICHAPDPIRISDDHGHSRFDVKEDRIRLGCRNTAPTTNHHNDCFSTAVLARMWFEGPGTKSEASRNGLVQRRTPVQVVDAAKLWILVQAAFRSQKRALRISGIAWSGEDLRNNPVRGFHRPKGITSDPPRALPLVAKSYISW